MMRNMHELSHMNFTSLENYLTYLQQSDCQITKQFKTELNEMCVTQTGKS